MKTKLFLYFKSIYLFILALGFILTLPSCNSEQDVVREKIDFTRQWKFELNDSSAFKLAEFNDHNWRILDLPHDWSIEGKFSESNPAGVGGGALPGGIGWYRKTFTLPASDSSKRIYITFDGVYQNSEVYINGHFLGKRPNGYISFQYDLTPYLIFNETENTIAVRVDNSDQPNSRWYSGSGIYRNVWLEKTNPIHINLWGTHVTTPMVSEQNAEVEIAVSVKNTTLQSAMVEVETKLLNADNKVVAKQNCTININSNTINEAAQKMLVPMPHLWSIETPYLYKAVSTVKLNSKVIDSYETTFGIRYYSYDSAKGFSLNGKPVKIKGVCNHHDLGALGAAVNLRATERQLEILKAMGCNGIRTSHNPPSPELLNLCDKMGFIVQDETFDVWAKKKVENDYARYWDEWHVTDLTDHLLRDRNHACIFSWSIGNEIIEQHDSTGITIARELASIVKKYAPDMPITSGCNEPDHSNTIIASGALDLIGYNYKHERFENFLNDYPGQKFIATESTSSLNSRGEYDMPSDSIRRWPYRWDEVFVDGNKDNTCSSYDNCSTPWGSTHEETWKIIKRNEYLSGFYIWTGFDYLGEPTPYIWPSRSSYFGIIDLAGFPKDIYYMYQGEWTDKPVLHLFPHWNWTEGQNIDIWAYTNFNEVELFVNGVSQGIKSKIGDDLHLQWNVIYESGSIKAMGKNPDGTTQEVIVNTASEPAKIKLISDRPTITANGKDLSFVTVLVLDKDGNLVPRADNLVNFEVSELASIAGVDNGNQTSHESFKANYRKAYNGKCLAIVQAKNEKGKLVFKASSEGLQGDSIEITLE